MERHRRLAPSTDARPACMRYQYRITKYDPKNRNSQGHYQVDEWTSISDVGKEFCGHKVTREEYNQVESAYLFAIESLLLEANISSLRISALEQPYEQFEFKLGAELGLNEILQIARLSLREELWCRLSIPRRAYVHFGYDYYMYMGVPRFCSKAIEAIQQKAVFVEPFRSPDLRALPSRPPNAPDATRHRW